MCKRASFILIAVLLALASCNGAADKTVLSLNDTTEIVGFDPLIFELTEEESAALARGEKPELVGSFGDLPTPIFDSEPPTGLNLRGQVSSDEVTRGTSTVSYFKCAKHKKFLCTKCKPSKDKKPKKDKKVKCKKPKCGGCNDCCPPPPPPPCPRSCVTGICNITERHWATGECGPAGTEVTYAAQVYFADGTTNKRGVEVIFKRDGVEVGRSWTDEHGVAYFKEHNVARGDHNIVVCVADCNCDACSNPCEPEEPCGPCDGKINALTLRYNGTTAANVTVTTKKSGTAVFSGLVQPGGSFSFVGDDKNGTLGTEIYVTVNGQSTAIHTSCSKPVGVGMNFGPFTVLAGSSLNGGPLCPGTDTPCVGKDCPPNDNCGPCDGKINALTLRYNGSVATTVTVTAKKTGQLFSDTVQPGTSFSFVGNDKDGTMGTEITISANGQSTAIHTSCSQPIEVGMDFGPFTVMAGSSRNGGPLCSSTSKNSSTVVLPKPCTPCGDPDDEGDSDCEYCDFEGPTYCSGRVIGVYTTCIYGAVTGTGYIDACNPLREGARAGMNFRNWYENGQVQGVLNFWDGSIKIVNESPTWMVMSGTHAWFGNDRWMVHVKDGGANFTDDFFEIFIWDQDYHCCGNLVGCYVNISFRYTNGIDTVAVKQ